jgi:hypothetical protein
MELIHHIHLAQLKLVSVPTIASAHAVLTLLDTNYLPLVPNGVVALYLSCELSAFHRRHHQHLVRNYSPCLNEIHAHVDCDLPGLLLYFEFVVASYILSWKGTTDFWEMKAMMIGVMYMHLCRMVMPRMA